MYINDDVQLCTFCVITLLISILEEKAAHNETKNKLAEFEKQAAETLKKIEQLNADRDELKEKMDILEKNVEKMITAIQEKDKG